MRQVIESYALILTIALLSILAVAFTSINLNIVQARRIYNDVRAEIQASNGAIIPTDDNFIENHLYYPYTETISGQKMGSDATHCGNETGTYAKNGKDFMLAHHYGFYYKVSRTSMTPFDHDILREDETFIYNSIYRIDFVYTYSVPLFGRMVYPIYGYIS